MNNLPNSPKSALSRRKFLGTALTGTAATLAGATLMSSLQHRTRSRPEPLSFRTKLSKPSSTATREFPRPDVSAASIKT